MRQSITYFENAVAVNPTSAGEHANLATALLLAGEKEQAEREVQIVRKLKPGTERMEQMDELLRGSGKGFEAAGVSR
jgi:Flp pilus assembly protein TadD